MKTIPPLKKNSFLKKRLDFELSPIEHGGMEYECDESKNSSCVEEEPPAWHAAALKEREWELKNCNVLGQNLNEAIKELKAEFGI